jgi:protein tyrosine phosphatase (PTP) superfamily phosphohydrolase (DUF442 family)
MTLAPTDVITYGASDLRYRFDETMALADIRNFLAVDERLGTAGQPTEAQLGDVATEGYVAVVNLGLLDPKYCLPDEAASVASLGLEYRHIPVKFDAPAVEDFRTFAATMNEWDGKKIFVHCAANYRVSTFVALYGELRLRWTRERADALMRKLWQPNDTWRAFIELCRRVQA